MALAITVNGGGTFSASMEEGPVSFTATLGAVPGPKGDTGATGPAGVVAATAPILYDSGTQTVSIDVDPVFNTVTASDNTFSTVLSNIGVTFPDSTQQTTAFVGEARKVYITARNNTGSTIAKGKVVYLSGATGNKATMALAQANSEATSARTIGVLVEETAANGDGKVIISGAAENIDTSAFTAGQVVYLSSSTAGGLQTTLPTQPNHGVVVGIVTRSSSTVGSIEVTIQNYQELSELSDVLIGTKANNDLLAWDSSSSVWKNKTFSTLGLLTSADAASTYLTSSTAASTYAPIASPTFTGTVTIPGGASISGYLTTATAASTYAPLASPAFTGNPTAPTPATSDNDTSIATTAFVNAYAPAASTTTAGKVELATETEATAGTSTTLAVTPKGVMMAIGDPDRHYPVYNAWLASTSGTGASTLQTINSKRALAPTSAVGYGVLYQGHYIARRGAGGNSGIDWSKRVELDFRVVIPGASADANSVGRVILGKASNSGVAGDPAVAAIGVRFTSGGNFVILAHNGTTLTTSTTSTSISGNSATDVSIVSDGAGNVELFVNGTSAGTTTGGPTAAGSTNNNAIHLEAENTSSLSGSAITPAITNVTWKLTQ